MQEKIQIISDGSLDLSRELKESAIFWWCLSMYLLMEKLI